MGVMGVPILTVPFKDVLDRLLSYWQPAAEFPVILVEHPIQNVSDRLLDERAQKIVEAALSFIE